MVYVDVPGLPKDLNVTYRPPRVSLFPPSYRDRAFLRSVHRNVLRQSETISNDTESNKKKTGKNVTIQLPFGKSEKQKPENDCQHECSFHVAEGKKNKVNEKLPKDQSNKKKDQKDCNGETVDEDNSTGNDSKQNKSKDKPVAANDKSKNQKDDSKLKIPDHLRSLLPYPFTSANADLLWANSTYQKPFPEKPPLSKENENGWNIDHRLDTARRADERYMWSYLSQQEATYQTDAFHWLAQRDAERQNRLAQLTRDLGSLSLDPEVGRIPLNFGSGHYVPADIHCGQYGRNNRYNATSVQAGIDRHGNIRLADGTMVVVNGQSTNQFTHQGPINAHAPLATINQGYNMDSTPCIGLQYHNRNFNQSQGHNGQRQRGEYGANRTYSPHPVHNQNWGANVNQGFPGPNTYQYRNPDGSNFQNKYNTLDNNVGQESRETRNKNGLNNSQINHDAWLKSDSDNNPWGHNTPKANNDIRSPTSNNNIWGQADTTLNSDGWGHVTDGNNYKWGDGNDENNRPDPFISSGDDNVVQDDNQNTNTGHRDSNNNGTQNDPFSSSGDQTRNKQAANRTMSGAKGLGSRSYPEYNDW